MRRQSLIGLLLAVAPALAVVNPKGCPHTAEPTKGDVPQNPDIFPPPDSTPPPTPRPASLEVSR
jgi:hypothetical protein